MGLIYVKVVFVLLLSSLMLDVGMAFPSSKIHGKWPSFNQTAIPPFGASNRWPMFNQTAMPPLGANGRWPVFNQTAMPPFGANGRWPMFNHTTKGPRKVIIGGAEKWRIGFNYSDWVCKNGPFFQDDTLVFKYDAPSKAAPIAHSVYLLPNKKSYQNCDLKKAKLLANTKQGVGKGFEYTLKSWKKPYFFACGESSGIHCGPGLMKFAIYPFYKRFH